MLAFLLAPTLPLLALALVVGLRHPGWLLAGYAAVVPWGSGYALPTGLQPSFSSVSTLAGLAASAGILAHLTVARERAPRLLAPLPAWIAFLALALLSVAWSVAPEQTLDDVPVLVSLVALYALAALLAVDRTDLRALEAGIVAGGVVPGLIGLRQLVTGTLPTTGAGITRFELPGGGGENGDPNITAAILLLPLVVAVGRALGADRRSAKLAYGGAVAITGVAIALTGSRAGFLAVAVSLLVLAFDAGAVRRGLALVAVPVLVVLTILALSPSDLQERVTQTGSSGRTDIWRVGWAECPDVCAAGSGWGTFPEIHERGVLSQPQARSFNLRFQAHQIWIETLVEIGVLGLLALLAALGLTAREALHLPRETRGPPLAALAGLVVTSTFVSAADFKYFWLVLIYVSVAAMSSTSRLPSATSRTSW